eukprot:6152614-Amphidinium_carterae.1
MRDWSQKGNSKKNEKKGGGGGGESLVELQVHASKKGNSAPSGKSSLGLYCKDKRKGVWAKYEEDDGSSLLKL